MIPGNGRDIFLFDTACWLELDWEGDACGALICLAITCFLVLFLRVATKLNGFSFVVSSSLEPLPETSAFICCWCCSCSGRWCRWCSSSCWWYGCWTLSSLRTRSSSWSWQICVRWYSSWWAMKAFCSFNSWVRLRRPEFPFNCSAGAKSLVLFRLS